MMPAVNYEPAGVMARIKKLNIGSFFLFFFFLKKATLHSYGGLSRQHHSLMTLQHRSTRDLWTNR